MTVRRIDGPSIPTPSLAPETIAPKATPAAAPVAPSDTLTQAANLGRAAQLGVPQHQPETHLVSQIGRAHV